MNLFNHVYAQGSLIDPGEDAGWREKIESGDMELNDIPLLLINFVDFISAWAGTISVIMLVWGGLKLIASGITEDKEGAKNTIKWALIGLIVSLTAWLIVNGIQAFLTR